MKLRLLLLILILIPAVLLVPARPDARSGGSGETTESSPAGHLPAGGSQAGRGALQAGSWVKYHIKRSQMEGAGFKTVWESNLKISIVGEYNKKGIHYYKVELVAQENTEDTRIVQFRVNPDGAPLRDKIIIKLPNLNPVEINLIIWSEKTGVTREELFQEMVGNLLITPLTPPETKRSTGEKVNLHIKDKIKTVACQRFIVEDPKDQSIRKLWYSREIPLPGVVKMFIFEESSTDGHRGTGQTQIMLVDYDTTGAVSLIKGKITKLEFKEKK